MAQKSSLRGKIPEQRLVTAYNANLRKNSDERFKNNDGKQNRGTIALAGAKSPKPSHLKHANFCDRTGHTWPRCFKIAMVVITRDNLVMPTVLETKEQKPKKEKNRTNPKLESDPV